ncbi:MAG: hypothetical protein ACRDNG_00660 [Gaiellaceae bacterium]
MTDEKNKPDDGFETSPERRGSSFQIGAQQAGSIQRVEGDLTIGAADLAATSTAELRRELARLADEVARVPVPASAIGAVDRALAAAAAESHVSAPDRKKIAEFLVQAARALCEAGVLRTAEARPADAFRRAAVLLGPAGKAVLAALPPA